MTNRDYADPREDRPLPDRDFEDITVPAPDDSTDGTGGGDPTRDTTPAQDPLGSAGGLPGLLRGATITKVKRDGEDLWFATYEYPPGSGQKVAFQFENIEQVYATIGEDFWQKDMFAVETRSENWLTRENVIFADSAAAVIGVEGTFSQVVEDIMLETAREMGINDPGALGRFLSNPEIQSIIGIGAMTGQTDEAILGSVRSSEYYNTVMYPGISAFFDQGVADPEGEYMRYMANVENSLEMLGYERDADGSYRSMVGQLLGDGIGDEAFNAYAPTFKRAQDSEAYAAALNQWTERRLGKSLEFDDLFNLLAGETPPEIAQVVEEANIQYGMDVTALEAGAGLVAKLARETDLSEQELMMNFTQAERNLLALGDEGLARAGLSQKQLIQAAFGLPTNQDVSANEISRRATKFAKELALQDERKSSLFVAFDEEGRPTRPGLQAFRPIGE